MSTRSQAKLATSPSSKSAIRTVKGLVGLYVVISVLTLVAIVLLRNHPNLVTSAVWVRATIVVITSLLMYSFVGGMGRGNPRAYLRLRLVSAIMVVAIVVIILLPGDFPTWIKIEQAVCGLILLGVVAVANGKQLRSTFK